MSQHRTHFCNSKLLFQCPLSPLLFLFGSAEMLATVIYNVSTCPVVLKQMIKQRFNRFSYHKTACVSTHVLLCLYFHFKGDSKVDLKSFTIIHNLLENTVCSTFTCPG